MPGPMPFHLEKGPWICALEDLINGVDDEQVMGIYEKLTVDSEAPFRELVKQFAEQPSLVDDPNYNTYELRYGHLLGHWFGDRDGKPQIRFEQWLAGAARSLSDRIDVPEGDLTPDSVETLLADACERGLLEMLATSPDRVVAGRGTWPSTGFWRQYHGRVEQIVRRTFAEALKVALGLSEDGAPTRRLRLEIFWKCGQPWMEGWVTWSLPPTAPATGQVTVIFATPGTGDNVLTRPGDAGYLQPDLDRVPAEHGEAPRVDPEGRYPMRGMWLITHERHLLLPPVPSTLPTAVGAWIVPAIGPAYAGIGEVTVVAPRFVNGGMPEVEPAVTKRRPAEPPPERESTTASS